MQKLTYPNRLVFREETRKNQGQTQLEFCSLTLAMAFSNPLAAVGVPLHRPEQKTIASFRQKW